MAAKNRKAGGAAGKPQRQVAQTVAPQARAKRRVGRREVSVGRPRSARLPKLFVAVVWSGRPSQRPSGGFEAWIDEDRSVVAGQAMAAKQRWDANPRPFALPYRVLVGELLQEAITPPKFELTPLRPPYGDEEDQ